jgi:phage FluMu protein gp41
LIAFEILLLVENDFQRIRKKIIELDDVEKEEKFSHKRHDEKIQKFLKIF